MFPGSGTGLAALLGGVLLLWHPPGHGHTSPARGLHRVFFLSRMYQKTHIYHTGSFEHILITFMMLEKMCHQVVCRHQMAVTRHPFAHLGRFNLVTQLLEYVFVHCSITDWHLVPLIPSQDQRLDQRGGFWDRSSLNCLQVRLIIQEACKNAISVRSGVHVLQTTHKTIPAKALLCNGL